MLGLSDVILDGKRYWLHYNLVYDSVSDGGSSNHCWYVGLQDTGIQDSTMTLVCVAIIVKDDSDWKIISVELVLVVNILMVRYLC